MSLEGSWDVTFTTAMGAATEQWRIETVEGDLRVRITSDTGELTDEVLKTEGAGFSFGVPVPDMPVRVAIAGQLEDDRLTGTGKLGAMQVGTFEGTRCA